jgi:hypothetical protein
MRLKPRVLGPSGTALRDYPHWEILRRTIITSKRQAVTLEGEIITAKRGCRLKGSGATSKVKSPAHRGYHIAKKGRCARWIG